MYQSTNKPEHELLQNKDQPKSFAQPSFRTIEAHTKESDAEQMTRSIIGITVEPTSADILIEKLLTEGITFVSIKGISHVKFLITFEDVEMIKQGINSLRFLFIK